MSEESVVTKFAKQLIGMIRDPTIEQCDAMSKGRMRGERGEKWASIASSELVGSALDELIPDVVDEVLFRLLNAVDTNDLPLGYEVEGEFVGLHEAGEWEMAGWLAGKNGWIASYSSERFNRYLDDL